MGNFLGTGTPYGDGRNEFLITFGGSFSGQVFVQVTNSSGTGEYFLDAYTTSFVSTAITGDVYNDLIGDGIHDPSDPGLNGWTVDLFDASGAFVTSQITHNISGVDGAV